MPLYFAYGSNMSTARLVDRVGDAGVLGRCELRRYRHVFNKIGGDHTAKGNIEVHPDGRVWGVLFRLDDEQIRTLDAIEGGYRRIRVEVARADGTDVREAHTYQALRKDTDLEPTREYLSHYLRGAREHHLPDAYLQEIFPSWFWG